MSDPTIPGIRLCCIGKVTCPASLPEPKWQTSTSQLHVHLWTVNTFSLLQHMLLMKREIGSYAREKKCFSLSKKKPATNEAGLHFSIR